MTYDTEVAKTEAPSLPELYTFTSGTESERYTSFRETITYGGVDYTPRPIKRGKISYSTELKALQVSISAPVLDQFAAYIANQPVQPVTVTIVRVVYGSEDTNYKNIFSGRIQRVSVQNRTATATCRSGNTVLEARVPLITYQSYCNHNIFGPGCGLSEFTWRVAASVDSVSGSVLTITAADAYDDDYFRAGLVKHGQDLRMITDHTGDQITMQIPFDATLTAGTSVYLLPGCSGDPQICDETFGNLDQFLGMPYIPNRNPVYWGFMRV